MCDLAPPTGSEWNTAVVTNPRFVNYRDLASFKSKKSHFRQKYSRKSGNIRELQEKHFRLRLDHLDHVPPV